MDQEIRMRLRWVELYDKTGNAGLTCRRLEGAAKALRPLSPPSGPGQGKANHCHRLGPRVGGLSLGYWPGCGASNCLKEQ